MVLVPVGVVEMVGVKLGVGVAVRVLLEVALSVSADTVKDAEALLMEEMLGLEAAEVDARALPEAEEEGVSDTMALEVRVAREEALEVEVAQELALRGRVAREEALAVLVAAALRVAVEAVGVEVAVARGVPEEVEVGVWVRVRAGVEDSLGEGVLLRVPGGLPALPPGPPRLL